MKKILFAIAMLLCTTSLLKAQEEDWSFPVKYSGQRPVISDFVSAIMSQEDIGECLGEMRGNWELYLAGKPLPKDRSIVVDVKNGYVFYEATYREEGEPVYRDCIEFCYWNGSDGRHKVVAGNIVCTRDGVPYMGQYAGEYFYMYDGKTRRMVQTNSEDLGIEVPYPDDMEWYTVKLPRTGKTVEYKFHTPSGDTLMAYTWNGSTFVEK